jgi:hydrogenase maturation protein HypF
MPQTGSDTSHAQRWLIGGRIQGVGFRPFVCLLANELGVNGSVRNYGGCVEVVAGSDPARAELFLRRLLSEHPPIARPKLVSAESWEPLAERGFRILASAGGAEAVLLPDQSVCDSCLAEMADPQARRYRYPFITCTQCGPRYTITRNMPFDRATTGMAAFPLCASCQAEYDRPEDRRFHAQVMACPDCGPSLCYRSGAYSVFDNQAAVARAVAALGDGAIVAVKGIGGYHLLCDASNSLAVHRLRARKRRPAKPLAVLFPRAGSDELEKLRLHCAPTVEEARSLRAPERPIVLVPLRTGTGLSPALAPGLTELGAFLPYSPLHDLIAGRFDGPLVATSGNLGGEPILTEPADAERLLASVADAFLHHDRPILQPADDGVVRVIAGRPRPLRLGRGSAPVERLLPRPVAEPVLALGGQMKVTLALGFGSRVVISPHLGNLGSPRSLELLETTAETLQRLYGVRADPDLRRSFRVHEHALGPGARGDAGVAHPAPPRPRRRRRRRIPRGAALALLHLGRRRSRRRWHAVGRRGVARSTGRVGAGRDVSPLCAAGWREGGSRALALRCRPGLGTRTALGSPRRRRRSCAGGLAPRVELSGDILRRPPVRRRCGISAAGPACAA